MVVRFIFAFAFLISCKQQIKSSVINNNDNFKKENTSKLPLNTKTENASKLPVDSKIETIPSVLKKLPLLPKGFVYLQDFDQTIKSSLRYAITENFIGKNIAGYNDQLVILTDKACQSLKKAQEIFLKDGYSLVVYDAYRPKTAVQFFYTWSQDPKDNSQEKLFYPRIMKSDLYSMGYLAKTSGHSRGSTVDVTLIEKDKKVRPGKNPKERTLSDGFKILYTDDGTIDMGSSFDLFDQASHTDSSLVEPRYTKMRLYLKKVMESVGFKNYAAEWWHFTLNEEPFQDGFDFPIGQPLQETP